MNGRRRGGCDRLREYGLICARLGHAWTGVLDLPFDHAARSRGRLGPVPSVWDAPFLLTASGISTRMRNAINGLWRGWRVGRVGRLVRRSRHHFEFWGMRCLAEGVPRLSRPWVLRLAKVAGRLAYWIDGRGRRLAYENLSLAVSEGGLDLAGRSSRQVVQACYANFARTFVDLFWFAGRTAEQAREWIEIEGAERFQRVTRRGDAAIYVTPHYGSFELSGLAVGFFGVPLNVVAQEFRNRRLTEIFRRARGSSGHAVHSRDGVMLKLLRMLRDRRSVAISPDLSVPPQGAATLIQLFGIPASVTALHVELAKRCSVQIIAAVCEPTADGKAKLQILEVYDPPPEETTRGSREKRCEMTQRIWDRFETLVRRRPEMWLWMYRHWRYRPMGETDAGGRDQLGALDGGDRSTGEESLNGVACSRVVRTPRFPSYSEANAEFSRRWEAQEEQ